MRISREYFHLKIILKCFHQFCENSHLKITILMMYWRNLSIFNLNECMKTTQKVVNASNGVLWKIFKIYDKVHGFKCVEVLIVSFAKCMTKPHQILTKNILRCINFTFLIFLTNSHKFMYHVLFTCIEMYFQIFIFSK